MTRNVGLLGSGAMGSSIARRLLAHSHDVVAWNRSPAPLAELVEAGARPAAAAGEAVGAPVSFSMFASDIATDSLQAGEHFQHSAGGCMSALRHHCYSRRQGRLHLAETVAHEAHLELPTARAQPSVREGAGGPGASRQGLVSNR
ncbi:NAD(P)-binding domain-containing protein [Streptomyces sp. NBC_00268]|uniref:NAD(P)-binding domain-containing protein n=1 Tax=Streptomyces sp. NBC_00268 TaxID=2975695 RepID=UPI0022504F45|nr:NAD(P)-binding domain-containing protein [Streptomyces sp. NBC_00268]MCX4404765.1 NAD(P)-binding domain-containing protein [Streptomyces sp. NBC_01764]MCX5190688.1 NAD(P)-binding domain-containing protein [Streptomyces sp. NBC_00268]